MHVKLYHVELLNYITVMSISLELNNIPTILRSFRVWIQTQTNTATVEIGLVNGDKKILNLDNSCCSATVLQQTSHDQTQIEIKVLQGKIKIITVEINHSWKINPYFHNTYFD